MKRSMFVIMALLLATPALGVVTMTCTDEGSGIVEIAFTATGEELVRAFALDVTLDPNTVSITDVNNYDPGEGNKYGIYPGTIDLTDLNSPVWGSPVAPANDPGAGGTGIGTNRVILEMGSLYEPNLSGPPQTDVMLCKIRVDGTCDVSIAAESTRGGIVLEDGNPPDSIISAGCHVEVEPPCTYPECWDYPTQCHADSDGDCDVDTADWPPFRDGFMKSYPDPDYLANACGDYNRDGTINTADWPEFRDNFMKTCATGLAQDCTPGDINGIYCP